LQVKNSCKNDSISCEILSIGNQSWWIKNNWDLIYSIDWGIDYNWEKDKKIRWVKRK
jgi:hypothetical protein